MKQEEFIEELETLILNNEDDFDRGKGKFILREYISSLKSSPQEKAPKVGNNEKAKEVCPVCKGKGEFYSYVYNDMHHCSECYGTGHTG